MNTNISTRLLAARVLTKVLNDHQSLTAVLEATFRTVDSPKERAFIQALCYGVCRNYYWLDFILSSLIDKPIKDAEIKALVLTGLFQLKFMRVKPYAAVSETVMATHKKPWAKALVNALLRNYLRQQEVLENKADLSLCAKWSHPDWLIKLIKQNWPQQAEQIFFENNQQPPMVLRVNLTKISRADYLQQLNQQGIKAFEVDFCQSALLLNRPVTIDLLPGFADGLVSVQDSAAQIAAELLDVKPAQRVLDVCAAPGGKSSHLLESQPLLKELVAVDIDASRMQRISENLSRLQQQATLIVGDAEKPSEWWDGQSFERILVDAPCSATGVIRRHPDIKLLRRAEDIAQLQTSQKNILNAIWPLLAPGGVLLYATCSILKQENQRQIESFLVEHGDAFELPLVVSWGVETGVGRQILTGESGMDGFYYARIGKR